MKNGGDDPLRNWRDPLHKVGGPNKQLELFKKCAHECNGYPSDDVIGAAVNLLINALRGAYGDRRQVEARFNDLVGRSKQALLDHYDGVSGKRRNIFPFDQRIEMPLFIDKDVWKRN